jgi:hypothetical protein
LLFGTAGNPKRADAVLDDVDQVIEIEKVSGIVTLVWAFRVWEFDGIHGIEEIPPVLVPVSFSTVHLKSSKYIVESGEVDERVNDSAHAITPSGWVGASDKEALFVQPHGKGNIPIIYAMTKPEGAFTIGFRQVYNRDKFLDPMWDVQVGVLGRLIGRLAIGIGL